MKIMNSLPSGQKVLLFLVLLVILSSIMILKTDFIRFNVPYSSVLLDRNNALLAARIASDGQWRFPPQKNVPVKFRQALILFEDKRFNYHLGIDPIAIVRAAIANFKTQKIVSGASTLNMQIARLSRPSKSRTIFQKLIEILLALHLEVRMNKDEIIALYASHAPFGGNVVGLEAASWRYFGRDAMQLSWAEAAMLAVLPNNPALIHPGRNRETLITKRNRLLEKLKREGIIDSLTCTLARAELLPPEPHDMPNLAPHLLDRIGINETQNTTPRFISTIDKNLQLNVQNILDYHYQVNSANRINNAAALIIDVHDGSVLVYAGNILRFSQIDNGNHVDLVNSPRSTGSLLKPFLYAGMLQAGDLLPTQLVADIPTRMGGFAPQNYNRTYEGAVPAWRALARSLNIPAVRMLQQYGVDRFYHLLKSLGMSTLFRNAEDYGLSLILGGAEGTLWDITSIYTKMAHQVQKDYNPADRNKELFVHYRLHPEIKKTSESPTFVLNAGACWLTFEAMLEVARPGIENSWRNFSSTRKIAWKTGTSYGHRDAWAVGVTSDYVIGVWTGNASGEGRPGLTGLSVSAPILFDIIDLLPSSSWFIKPEADLHQVRVCRQSGYLMSVNCAEGQSIWSCQAGENPRICPFCKITHCDSTLTWQINTDCENIQNIRQVSWFVLPPAMEWYYMKNNAGYRPLPTLRDGCESTADMPIALIYPQNNSKIYVPRELDGKLGRTVFTATHRNYNMKLYWHLDNQFIGSTTNIHQMALVPSPGKHRLTVVDEAGHMVERNIYIIRND